MMKCLEFLAVLLLIIGGLNWGLVGLFNFNLVDAIFGMGSIIARIIYILVGLSAICKIFLYRNKECRICK